MTPLCPAITADYAPVYARRSSPSALLADMLRTLEDCVTEPQLRAWVSATAEFRAVLPELLLQRLERKRTQTEAVVGADHRRRIIAGHIEHSRSLGQLAQDHRPQLLVDIQGALHRHPMTESSFGRRALRDPAFVGDLRRGRQATAATQIKVRALIARLDAEGGR